MKKISKHIKRLPLLLVPILIGLQGCYEDESITLGDLPTQTAPVTNLDKFLFAEFQQKHNCMVRYKFVDRYVDDSKRVTPPDKDIVGPYMTFVRDYWAGPFYQTDAGSNELIHKHYPAEIVLIGSPMYNQDGTVTLGTADAGVRITLTEVNNFNLNNTSWIRRQLHVMQHEFTHIIHQNYDLPNGYQKISEGDYSGPAWTIKTDEEMLKLGFVTPYASNNPNEDFAELVAHILTMGADGFNAKYIDITGETDPDIIKGKLTIKEKYESAVKYYREKLNIDLENLQANAWAKITGTSQSN
ncbi:hypothetical protein FUAX_46780 (plasmid) [Fulvitalea axinellae]|uniref:Substrate import-associated zinc metallohydrolase lipoprotein n=1 Tax=Fulvitalea axinellae TaxID=1182444 RepID=A0AAU9CJF8_9BACT|nr:hypothetical protein FUAX_46780 [Fulvitalea axinellae]